MKILFTFLMILSLISCSEKLYTPETFKGPMVTFGTGGGFSGRVTSYTLLENGQLFKIPAVKGEIMEIQSLDKAQSKQLISSLIDLEIDKVRVIKALGGADYMTNFITLITADGEKQISWSEADKLADENVSTIFNNLYTLSKRNEKTNK